MSEIVYPIAKKLGFTLEVTGKWSKIVLKDSEIEYGPSKSPFR